MKRKTLGIILLNLAVVFSTYGQDADFTQGISLDGASGITRPEEIFLLSAELPVKTAARGETLEAVLKVEIPEDHYLYRDKITVEVSGERLPVELIPITLPPGVDHKDPATGNRIKVYEGSKTFPFGFKVLEIAGDGEYDFVLKVSAFGCSSTMCFPPFSREFNFHLTVKGGPEPPAKVISDNMTLIPTGTAAGRVKGATGSGEQDRVLQETFGGGLQQSLSDSLRSNVFLALPISFLLGLLTSLTPCVYPLIPITISIFGATSAKSRWDGFFLSLVYVLGIVVTYSIVGAAVIGFGFLFGSISGNPFVTLGISMFFVLMGLSMLGAFSVTLPSGLQGTLTKAAGQGFFKAFLMGLAIGIVAAPCTGPALALILAFAHQPGQATVGMAAMVAYALGLGTLFLVLGTFAGSLSRLPKSGEWMDMVKSVFAILIFVAALYYMGTGFPVFKGVFSAYAGSPLIAASLVAASFVLGAYRGNLYELNPRAATAKTVGIIAAVTACYLLILGPGIPSVYEGPALEWTAEFDEGLILAREEKRPVIIDFTADWCMYCKQLDSRTFSDPRVQNILQRFVRIRVDLSTESLEESEIRKKYRIYGLPTVLLFKPGNNQAPYRTVSGFVGPDTFLKYLSGV